MTKHPPPALQAILNIPIGQKIAHIVAANGGECRFVGGIVRDAFMGLGLPENPDIDMATTLAPEEAMMALEAAGLRVLPTGITHGTITVFDSKNPELQVHLTSLRQDISADGRHAKVRFTDDWLADASRRDFTINSITLDHGGQIFDPFDGIADLQNGTVRFIGNAADRLAEDYLRILRFFRFFARFGKGQPDAAAFQAVIKAAPNLKTISGQRIAQELAGLLECGSSIGLKAMVEAGVEKIFTPCFHLDFFDRLTDFDESPPFIVSCAALIETNETDKFSKRLHLSKNQSRRLNYLALPITGNLVDENWQQTAWKIKPDQSNNNDLAWRYAVNAAKKNTAINADIFQRLQKWQRPEFPITGNDLKKIGMTDGVGLGKMLKKIETKWALSDFNKNRDELLADIMPKKPE